MFYDFDEKIYSFTVGEGNPYDNFTHVKLDWKNDKLLGIYGQKGAYFKKVENFSKSSDNPEETQATWGKFEGKSSGYDDYQFVTIKHNGGQIYSWKDNRDAEISLIAN